MALSHFKNSQLYQKHINSVVNGNQQHLLHALSHFNKPFKKPKSFAPDHFEIIQSTKPVAWH